MKLQTNIGWSHLSDDVLDLLLDEAERAIFDVEARSDEPGRRIAPLEAEPPGVTELRLAIAELVDAFPGIQHELELVSDRLRNTGARAASSELEARPHIIDLVRMSLEAFFRQFPTIENYEVEDATEETDEDVRSAGEVYEAYVQLIGLLRNRLN